MSINPSWDASVASEIIKAHAEMPGATLPVLHALQEAFGYVDDAAIPEIAAALNFGKAEIYGVLTFYHDFRRAPAGRHVLKLCRAEACQSMGGEKLARDLLARFGLDWGGTTDDERLTVEPVYCLGFCACAPAALLDGEPLGRLSGERLARAVDEVAP